MFKNVGRKRRRVHRTNAIRKMEGTSRRDRRRRRRI